jgi:predicted ester cyclase
MSEAQRKDIVRRFWNSVVSHGELDLVDDIIAPDFKLNHPISAEVGGNMPGIGPAGVRKLLEILRTGIPDIEITIEQQIAQGNLVATRWSARGHHTGDIVGGFGTLVADGAAIEADGISISRFARNKIAETWIHSLAESTRPGTIPGPKNWWGRLLGKK